MPHVLSKKIEHCSDCGRPVAELTSLFTQDVDDRALCISCHNYNNLGRHSYEKDPAFDKWLKEYRLNNR